MTEKPSQEQEREAQRIITCSHASAVGLSRYDRYDMALALIRARDAERERAEKAEGLLSKLNIQHGCKHAEDHGIAPIEYQRAVERMLQEQERAQKAEARLQRAEELLRENEDVLLWDDPMKGSRSDVMIQRIRAFLKDSGS